MRYDLKNNKGTKTEGSGFTCEERMRETMYTTNLTPVSIGSGWAKMMKMKQTENMCDENVISINGADMNNTPSSELLGTNQSNLIKLLELKKQQNEIDSLLQDIILEASSKVNDHKNESKTFSSSSSSSHGAFTSEAHFPDNITSN